ncbi:MAG: hypothetical protein JST59_23735 [Actinobacteria bacterium]|nr:hypothetical protein [Actinomycetota bacterium]
MAKISNTFNADLGRQLSRKVSKGLITEAQAQRTSRQRATLAAIYGPNWRTRIYGVGGAKALEDPEVIKAKRTAALKKAKVIKGRRGANGGTSYLEGQ